LKNRMFYLFQSKHYFLIAIPEVLIGHERGL
jgi:hypothetical protein